MGSVLLRAVAVLWCAALVASVVFGGWFLLAVALAATTALIMASSAALGVFVWIAAAVETHRHDRQRAAEIAELDAMHRAPALVPPHER